MAEYGGTADNELRVKRKGRLSLLGLEAGVHHAAQDLWQLRQVLGEVFDAPFYLQIVLILPFPDPIQGFLEGLIETAIQAPESRGRAHQFQAAVGDVKAGEL